MHDKVSTTVAVIGGGILGVATAAQLARSATDVVLITESELASGASGRSLSWLNSFLKHPPAYHRLRMEGMERYRAFARTHDAEDYLRFDGGIYWPTPGGADVDELVEHLTTVGYPVERLSPAEATARGLGLNEAVLPETGILHTTEDGWVDLPSLIRELSGEFVRDGGVIRTGVGKVTVEVQDGRVSAVVLGDGSRLPVDAVVMATGADVPEAAKAVGTAIEDSTPVAVLVRTKPVDVRLKAVINSPRIAVRPNVGGNLVLDRSWAEEHVVRHGDGTYSVPDEIVAKLLEEASAVLEGTPRLELDSVAMGPKPIPGDGHPVVGELDDVSGYFVAFTHSGATLGLILGELLAQEVLGRRSPLLDAFRPGRFARV
jgi:glycine/D-amino acid oxidase-like deaminating enzyme